MINTFNHCNKGGTNHGKEVFHGGYIVGGTRYLGMPELYLVKTNASGEEQWSRTYGDLLHDFGHSVQQTQDGGYIFGGSKTSISTNDLDCFLVKTNSNGDPQWTMTYGGGNEDSGFSVRQIQDGGYIFVGNTFSYGAGAMDVYLIKTDANGNETWSKTYGGTSSDEGKSVQQTQDGGYIIAGETSSFGEGSWDIWLIRTDAVGDTLWTKTFGGDREDYGYSVQQTTDLGYIIAGYLCYGIGEYDAWLIRIAPDAPVTCSLGDVNDDGTISPGDALCAFQIYLSGGTPPPDCDNPCALEAADVNCSPNGVTPGDALYIFQAYLDGKIAPLDCDP